MEGATPYESEGRRVCGAKRRNGLPCQKPPLEGATRCRLHGGASPRGIASATYKDGRHSKYAYRVPKEIGAAYRKALNDQELVSLRHELAVTAAFIQRRFDELMAAEAPPWGDVVEAFNDYKVAPDEVKAAALAKVEELIRTGAAAAAKEYGVRQEVRELMQEKGKLAAAEWKRLNDLRAVVPAEQAVMFAQSVVAAVLEIYGRDSRLGELQRRLTALAPGPVKALPGPAVSDE
jgi:hypothetical protein